MAKLLTTLDLVNQIKSLIGKESAYAVAKFMGVTEGASQRWGKGVTIMDDDNGLKAAKALGLNPDYVLACLAAERAERQNKSAIHEIWARIAGHIPQAALFVLSITCIAAHAQSLV